MNHIAEAHSSPERKTAARLPPGLRQVVSCNQVVRDELFAPVGRKREVAGSVGEVERTANQIAFGGDMFRPWDDTVGEGDVGARLVARQSTLLHEVEAELTEAIAILVVVELRAGQHGEPRVAEARTIAVAVFQAQTHHPTHDQRHQMLVVEQRGRHDFAEDVQRVQERPCPLLAADRQSLRSSECRAASRCVRTPASRRRASDD